jgi:hypothetical protein
LDSKRPVSKYRNTSIEEIFDMRKSSIFISVVLTTFVLAMLASVAYAYQEVAKAKASLVAAQATVTETVQPVEVGETPVPTQPTPVMAEQAAALAAQALGQNDLYSVELTTFNDADAYLVTFSSGNLVYVGLDGQILSQSKLQVASSSFETTVQTKQQANKASNNSNSGSHEKDDHEHEDGED